MSWTYLKSYRSFLLFFLILAGHTDFIFSQNTIDSVEFCCEQNDLDSVFRVQQFKGELEIELKVSEVILSGVRYPVKVKYRRKFTELSEMIELRPDMLLQIAVIRAYKSDVKFYLYDIYLFAVENNQWNEVSAHHWEFLQLEKEIKGRWYGELDEPDCYGFVGSLTIR